MDALDSLVAALAVSPDNLPLRTLAARTALEGGKYAKAIEICRVGLELTLFEQELTLLLAKALRADGNAYAASLASEDLLRHYPDALESWELHTHLLLDQERFAEAKKAFDDMMKRFRGKVSMELQKRIKETMYKHGSAMVEEPDVDDFIESMEENGGIPPHTSGGWYMDDGTPFDTSLHYNGPPVSFADVGGLGEVKEQISLKAIHPFRQPDLYKAYGMKAGGGILLYGPPGCGKTLLARATAGEAKAEFLSVSLYHVLDMWIGNSEKNMHKIFEQARCCTPAVLFFDEVDALAAKRSDMRRSDSRSLINQFLEEMDGLNKDNESLLVLAATNAPWYMDSAFLRPGRFDRTIFVPPPDQPAREAIFKLELTGKPAAGVDLSRCAKATQGYSGADIMGVVKAAIEAKITNSIKTGKVEPLTTDDVLTAARKTKPSTAEWFATAKNYALYSNEGGRYDEVLEYMGVKK